MYLGIWTITLIVVLLTKFHILCPILDPEHTNKPIQFTRSLYKEKSVSYART